MFNSTGRTALSVLLITSLIFTLSGFYLLTSDTKAASVTNITATSSSSAPAASSSMTIKFVTPTGVSGAADKTLTIELDTSGTSFVIPDFASSSDVDIATSSDTSCSSAASFSDMTIGASTSTSQWTASFNTTTDVLTLTYPGGGNTNTQIGAGTCVQIEIGSAATTGATGRDYTNPTKSASAGTADTYGITIGGTFGDSGETMVAIIEGVTVSATVNESLSFSMTGVTTGSCTGDSGSPTVVDTSGSSTTIPFGTLSGANTFYVGCHRLSVSTNASSGFSSTIEENTNLITGSGVVIPDTTCDGGSCSETATDTWATATGNDGFGFSCENISGNGLCRLGTNGAVTTYMQIACRGSDAQCDPGSGGETKQVFISTSTPVDTADVRLHYKLTVSGTQPAGSYSNTVSYITTPQF